MTSNNLCIYDSDEELDLNGEPAKECDHNKDRCGCYLSLQEEKSLLEYKLKKYQEKQNEFLSTIRKAVLDAFGVTNDENVLLELTKLESLIDTQAVDLELPNANSNNLKNKRKQPLSSTSTSPSTTITHSTSNSFISTSTTTSTTSTTSTSTVDLLDSPLQEANKKIKTYDNKPCKDIDINGHNISGGRGDGQMFKTPVQAKWGSDMLTPEDLASILKQEDEERKKEREKLANDDFQVALSFQPRQCPLCLDEVEVDFITALSQCQHEYCRECLIHYVTDKITSKSFPINCPLPECKKEISVYDFEMLLDAKMMDKYNEFVFSSTIEANPETYSCCPTADCGYVFLYEKGDSSDFSCPKCAKRYCLTCRADFHQGSTCEQYQAWLKENGQADQLFEQFAQGMKLKKCPKCNRWTEKISGCNHMSCKCGQKFCYHCGNSYPCACGQDPHVNMAMQIKLSRPTQFKSFVTLMRPGGFMMNPMMNARNAPPAGIPLPNIAFGAPNVNVPFAHPNNHPRRGGRKRR